MSKVPTPAIAAAADAGTAPASVSFAYDSRDLVAVQTLSNSLSSAYSYDGLGRLLSIKHQLGLAIISSRTMIIRWIWLVPS